MSAELLRAVTSCRRATLLFLVFGLPIVFLWDVTYDAFNIPKIALLATCVGLAGGARLLEIGYGRPATELRGLSLPALFIALPLTTSWVFNGEKLWTLMGEHTRFEGLIPYLLVIAAGMLIAEACFDRPLALAWAFISAGAAVGSYALLQAFGLDPLALPLDPYVGSTIGHGNFVGGYLAIVLPVALTVWIGGPKSNLLAAIFTILIAVGLVLSLSQGAWAAGIAGSAVALGSLFREKVSWARAIGGAVATLVAIVIAGNVLLAAFSPNNALVGGTTRARAEWWKAAGKMGMDAPILGHGPNAYALKSPAYRTPIDALGHGHRLSSVPHSVPLSFFANTGVFGLLGFLGMLAWAITQGWSPRSSLHQGFFAGFVAYGVQAVVSVDQPVLVFALWVCLAGMVTATPRILTVPAHLSRPRWASILALGTALLAVIGGVIFGGALIKADRAALSGTRSMIEGDVAQGRLHFAEALSVRDVPVYRVTLAIQLGRAALEEEEDGLELIDEMRKAVDPLRGRDYLPAITSEARALHLWSIYDESAAQTALALLDRAASIDPFNPQTQAWLAETLLGMGRPAEALSTVDRYTASVEEYLESRSYTAPVWAAAAVAAEQLGYRREALDHLQHALDDARSTGTEFANCAVVLARVVVGHEDRLAQLPEALLCPEATVRAFGLAELEP